MRAVIAALIVIAIAALAVGCDRPPARWIGMDRAAAACSSDGGWRQTCVTGGHRYTCVSDDGGTWQCAPFVVDVNAEARP